MSYNVALITYLRQRYRRTRVMCHIPSILFYYILDEK